MKRMREVSGVQGVEPNPEAALSPRASVRLAALFLLIGGLVTLINNNVHPPDDRNETLLDILAVAASVVAVAGWRAPWERLSRRTLVAPAFVGMVFIGAGEIWGGSSPRAKVAQALYLLLVFVWTGITQPPRTTYVLAPFAVITYVLPHALWPNSQWDLSVASVLIPVCVVMGEGLARLMERERTNRDRADGLAHRYESLLQALSDLDVGFIVADRERVLYANDALSRINGYSRTELQSMPNFLETIVPEQRRAVTERLARRLQGQSEDEHYEITIHHKRGHRVELELVVKRIQIDGLPYATAIIRDITERKRAEEALRASERAFAAAYERERQAAEGLRAVDEMKNAFLSAVSHELRTPLAIVLGSAITLQERAEHLTGAHARALLTRLAANAQKLERLLLDLLDLDRLARGVLEPHRQLIDIEGLVRRVAEDAETQGRPLHVCAEPVRGWVDPAQIERILENLLVNAVKHTFPETSIWIGVRHQDGHAVLFVEDNGPGIEDSLKEVLFEPFRRGDDSSPAPGTGIGLSLVSKFAQLHGGRAWVEDRAGGGCRFQVELPLDKMPARSPA